MTNRLDLCQFIDARCRHRSMSPASISLGQFIYVGLTQNLGFVSSHARSSFGIGANADSRRLSDGVRPFRIQIWDFVNSLFRQCEDISPSQQGFSRNLERSRTEILTDHANRGIMWKFIPEGAFWLGGFWERVVKTTKQALIKITGTAYLTEEELRSTLCKIEAVVNSRPFTYVYNDHEEAQRLIEDSAPNISIRNGN